MRSFIVLNITLLRMIVNKVCSRRSQIQVYLQKQNLTKVLTDAMMGGEGVYTRES